MKLKGCLPLAILVWLIGMPCVFSERELLAPKLRKDQGPGSDYAYVTFLYGEDFVLGVRVLGQSIRETRTKFDMVLIVTGSIRHSSLTTLQNDGWRLIHVDEIANPAKGPQTKGFPAKFLYVYTKLSIFNLTEYKKVVYLDADTIMTRNSDVLFNCPVFCAALRHSERLNSGVMVVTPSTSMYEDMIPKITLLPSYTGGDQGFLNAYFDEFADGLVFNPAKTYEDKGYKSMRLPTKFNADIGLYVLNSNRWMIPAEDIYIVHFTLGPIKPWQWWSSWVIKDVKRWDAFRNRLPKDSLGYYHGSSSRQEFCKHWMTVIPFVAFALLARRYFWKSGVASIGSSSSLVGLQTPGGPAISARSVVPKRFSGLSVFVGYSTLLFSLGFSLWMVPQQISGFWGWFLVNEWLSFCHFALFGLYLLACYHWGQKTAMSAQLSQRNLFNSKPWRTTLKSAICGLAWILLSPWVADLLNVQNLVTKILVTAVSAVIANVVLTHAYASLAIRWFAYGRSEAHVKSGDVV